MHCVLIVAQDQGTSFRSRNTQVRVHGSLLFCALMGFSGEDDYPIAAIVLSTSWTYRILRKVEPF